MRRGAAALIVAAATLLGTSPAVAARAPDLAVTAASKAPRSVTAGARLKLRVTVANRAGGKAGRSRVGLYLSDNAAWSNSDVELAAPGRTRALAARRRAAVTVKARIPRDAPSARRLRLLACADARHEVAERNEANNCRAAGSLIVVGGSSFEVIDAHVRLGRLKASRALLYKLFAVFGDRRLPRRYRGDGSRVSGTSAVQAALARLPSLPPALRAQVKPFLIPPGYRGSFAAKATAAVQEGRRGRLRRLHDPLGAPARC
jgi:CARDB